MSAAMNAVSGKTPNAEKGKRYLALLDQILCNASWVEVPELARKVEKHAPERNSLTLAARLEAQITTASHRPTSASSTGTSSIHSLGEAIPKLTAAIEGDAQFPDDIYCAKTCLAEIHWLQENPEAALKVLPDTASPSGGSTAQPAPLGWLEVCIVKGAFIKAASLDALGREAETAKVLSQASSQTPGSRTPELRRWTERLLARACTHNFQRTSQFSLETLNGSLHAFRAWGSFWQRSPPPSGSSVMAPSRLDTPRRAVWRSYYQLLSMILQRGLLYCPSSASASYLLVIPTDDVPENQYVDAKRRQREETRRIENTYELLLLNETQFPKSSDTNLEVEEWIEQAVANWKVFCGSGWTDADLEDGGKENVSRNLLDILYRAATKTFHSTAILRRLFTVHASVGEFELAMHAFNSYVEIVAKGKARAAKTGQHELGFDNDDIALLTAAEAVRVLCRYGDRVQGEKAVEVTKTIQTWLGEQRPATPDHVNPTSNDNKAGNEHSKPTILQRKTLAAAYRAIGVGQAHWARLTYEAETRNALQADAISHLKRAQEYDENSVNTAYALARVLAETRNVPAAIDVAKRCIGSNNDDEGEVNDAEEESRKRQLIPLWHMLSLCLTARDEYEPAVKMCGMAFDQFDDLSALFGAASPGDAEKSELSRASRGLIDHMDSFEKEGILQVKLTQLIFTELMEGAGAAVDMTDELLSLYARLFGSPKPLKLARKPPPTAQSQTGSRIGVGSTLRSIAGSIRPRSHRNSADKEQAPPPPPLPLPKTDVASGRTNGQATAAPIAITVTNEDGISTEKTHHHNLHLPFRHHHDASTNKPIEEIDEKAASPGISDSPTQDQVAINATAQGSTVPTASNNPEQSLKEIAHNQPHDRWPPPTGHDEQPPRQDVRLPTPHQAMASAPEPRLASLQERQHKVGLLVNVWLFIAGLYLRADLYDDASGAIQEATELVHTFETEKELEKSSARAFYFKGWGGGKSVDELWADVWSAKGDLSATRELPFEAMSHYEHALAHFPDHAESIIALSDVLMDIYEQKLPAEEPRPTLSSLPPTASTSLVNTPTTNTSTPRPAISQAQPLRPASSASKDPSPAELNRLAARDRAYMLVSNLTRLGSGWNNPEAWYTLARSHELSKQVAKAKQALWWVVELEDSRPIREWGDVGAGGYTL